MLKQTLLVAVVGVVGLAVASVPAAAADIPVKAPRTVVAAVYDWTGFYIGVHGGGGWARKNSTIGATTLGGIAVDASSSTVRPSGWLAGGQIGYNFYQSPTPWWLGGRFVLGIEAQASWADLDDSASCASTATVGGAPITLTANCSAEVRSLGTVALRYGTAFDRIFIYSKIGGAWARDRYGIVSTSPFLAASFSGREDRWGWMSGTGAEIALGNNWSVKGEYNYMSLGTETVRFSGTPAGTTFDADIKQRIHVVKFGLNYRFGAQPVVARY